MIGFCPSCGYNLVAEEPVADGPFAYAPETGFTVDGQRLEVCPSAHVLLGTVMQAGGRIVQPTALLERMGFEGLCERVAIAVRLSAARKAIAELSHAFPVETIWGIGFRWCLAARQNVHVRHRCDPVRVAA